MIARTDLPALGAIRALDDEMRATRQAIHANPEPGVDGVATSDQRPATSDRLAGRLQR